MDLSGVFCVADSVFHKMPFCGFLWGETQTFSVWLFNTPMQSSKLAAKIAAKTALVLIANVVL